MSTIRLIFIAITSMAQNATADILILNNGTQLEGAFAGGSRTRIRFEVDGKVRSLLIDEVKSLTFEREKAIEKPTSPTATRPESPTTEAVSLQATRTGKPTISLGKGTTLTVHITRTISTAKNRRNDRFTTHLTKAVTKGMRTLLPKDTQLHGRIIRSQAITKGKAILALELTTAQVNNRIYSLISNRIEIECDGNMLTVMAGESAFDSEIALGDFILESGDIELPENTPMIFELFSPLSLPEQ